MALCEYKARQFSSLRINSSLIQALHTVQAVKILYATMIVFFTDCRQSVSVSTKLDNVHHFAVILH